VIFELVVIKPGEKQNLKYCTRNTNQKKKKKGRTHKNQSKGGGKVGRCFKTPPLPETKKRKNYWGGFKEYLAKSLYTTRRRD